MVRLAWVVSLCAAFVLSACYEHKTDLLGGLGHVDYLPERVFMAHEDGKEAQLLIRREVGYELNDNAGNVKIAPIQGGFWVQVMRIKDGDAVYTSYAARQSGDGFVLLHVQSGSVSDRDELVAKLTAALANNAVSGARYKMIDIGTARGQQEAQAFVANAERLGEKGNRDAAKPNHGAQQSATSIPPAQAQDIPKQAGRFVFVEEEDVMTGAKKQFIYGFPEGGTWGQPPYIRLGCYGPTDQYPVGLTVAWATALNDIFPREPADAAHVTVRFGENAPLELGWAVSRDFSETYPPDTGLSMAATITSGVAGIFAPEAAISRMQWNWDGAMVHRAFRSYNRVALRGYPRSGQDITLLFDTAGYRDVLENFRPHCRGI